MQVRGRGDRISFAESFKDIYNFRLLYGSSVAFFPIKARKRSGGTWYFGCSCFEKKAAVTAVQLHFLLRHTFFALSFTPTPNPQHRPHPTQGAVMKSGPWEPYVVFDRRNKEDTASKSEEYVPLGTFDDDPDSGNLTPLWSRSGIA